MEQQISQHRGAIIAEIAITIPVFLFGVLIFLWIGVLMNQRTALQFGVNRAVRLAITRSDVHSRRGQSTHSIHDIEDWLDGGAPSERLKHLFTQGVPYDEAQDFYNRETTQIFAHASRVKPLDELPSVYSYTLVYLNETLRHSIGPTIKFPCDPKDDQGILTPLGSGCMKCQFLNPDSLDLASFRGAPPSDKVALSCEYQPSTFISASMVGLLRSMGISAGNSLFSFSATGVAISNRNS